MCATTDVVVAPIKWMLWKPDRSECITRDFSPWHDLSASGSGAVSERGLGVGGG